VLAWETRSKLELELGGRLLHSHLAESSLVVHVCVCGSRWMCVCV